MSDAVEIRSRDYWVKLVDMLQQNWALVDVGGRDQPTIYFIDDRGHVFDQVPFDHLADAETALTRNDFRRFHDAPDLQAFLKAPSPPFRKGGHPNGPIYSSGRFWR